MDIETKTTNKAIINTYREASELINFIEKEKEALFQDKLFEMIDDKNLDQVELYKKARIDRRHFSKIKSEKDYREENL